MNLCVSVAKVSFSSTLLWSLTKNNFVISFGDEVLIYVFNYFMPNKPIATRIRDLGLLLSFNGSLPFFAKLSLIEEFALYMVYLALNS